MSCATTAACSREGPCAVSGSWGRSGRRLAVGNTDHVDERDGDELWVAWRVLGPVALDDDAGLLDLAQRILEVFLVAAGVVDEESEQVDVAVEVQLLALRPFSPEEKRRFEQAKVRRTLRQELEQRYYGMRLLPV